MGVCGRDGWLVLRRYVSGHALPRSADDLAHPSRPFVFLRCYTVRSSLNANITPQCHRLMTLKRYEVSLPTNPTKNPSGCRMNRASAGCRRPAAGSLTPPLLVAEATSSLPRAPRRAYESPPLEDFLASSTTYGDPLTDPGSASPADPLVQLPLTQAAHKQHTI